MSAFPAFERAQANLTKRGSLQAEAPATPKQQRTDLTADAKAATHEETPSYSLPPINFSPDGGSSSPAAPAGVTVPALKITKRINARLQLAAALIEADNEDIVARASAAQSKVAGVRHDPDTPRPAPPPQPRLASESAIFAPYRETTAPLPSTRPRAGSNASRLSRLTGAGGNTQHDASSERRSSVDFLGVRLPTEKRYGHSHGAGSVSGRSFTGVEGSRHSRSNSLMSQNGPLRPGEAVWEGPGSRPASAMSGGRRNSFGGTLNPADDAEASEDEALSDWGVDKFLSSDARTRITGRRSRANSVAMSATGRPGSVISAFSDAGDPRSKSEVGTGVTQNVPGAAAGANAELLARIKLYRERQENLPPSQWEGPGPKADAQAVAAHLASPGKTAKSMGTPEQRQSMAQSLDSPAKIALFRTPSPGRSIADSGEVRPSMSASNSVVATLATSSALDSLRAQTQDEAVKSGLVSHLRSATVDAAGQSLDHRRESSAAILGDSWSDEGSGPEDDEEDVIETLRRMADAEDQAVAAAAAAQTTPVAAAPSPAFGSARAPSAVFSMPRAPSAVFASPGPRHAMLDTSADYANESALDDDDMPQENMVGIGSFSRSQSRRNSLMSSTLLSGQGLASGARTPPAFGPGMIIGSRPGTPSGALDGRLSPSPSGFTTPILSVGAVLARDPYSDMPIGPSPYPSHIRQSPAARLMELAPDPLVAAAQLQGGQRRQSMPMHGLSTRQLQAMARESAFPEYYGIGEGSGLYSPIAADDVELYSAAGLNPAVAIEAIERQEKAREAAPTIEVQEPSDARQPSDAQMPSESQQASYAPMTPSTSKSRVLSGFFGGGVWSSAATPVIPSILAPLDNNAPEPDLSSARWGWKRRNAQAVQDIRDGKTGLAAAEPAASTARRSRIPFMGGSSSESALIDKLQKHADEQGEVDDTYISPPRVGPLRPRGLAARAPKTIIMPEPLQGSRHAPRLRLTDPEGRDALQAPPRTRNSGLYVPDGFVLHDGKGLPPMRQLQVGGAAGPRPLFMTPDGDRKHDAVVSDFLTSADGRRVINVPAAAPLGIGRRAAVPTTALFRNQLVQHDEEREGWGWEEASAVAPEKGEEGTTDYKKTRADKRAEKKALKEKRKRKAARRERRRKREDVRANGTTYSAVDDESPAEDLDLSDDTSSGDSDESDEDASEDSWNSEDEKRWIDNQKPAGKLFGKSLLDIAAEKKQVTKSKNKFYGQTELEEMARADAASVMLGDGQSLAPSAAAKSFRDNPLGYNDTRERMQAAFGTDLVWAREMAKRREEEAREAEEREVKRLAEIEFRKAEEERKLRKMKGKKGKLARAAAAEAAAAKAKAEAEARAAAMPEAPEKQQELGEDDLPPRSRTPIEAPQIDLALPSDDVNDGEATIAGSHKRALGVSEAAAEWFARSDESDNTDDDESSEDEAERRRAALQRARQSRILSNDLAAAQILRDLGKDESDSDEDNVPLSQLRNKRASAMPSLAAGLQLGRPTGGDSTSEEETPLADIIAKRKARTSTMGHLDLNFMGSTASLPAQPRPSGSSRSPVLNVGILKTAESDSDSDDAPLGLKHANGATALAALAAKKAAGELDDSDADSDDRPLGAAHPQAALIAQQHARIQQLEAEAAQARLSLMPSAIPAFGYGYDPRMSYMGGGMSALGMPSTMSMAGMLPMASPGLPVPSMQLAPPPPGSDMMQGQLAMPSPMAGALDPKVASIDRWRNHVPPDATGSGSGNTSKEGSSAAI